MFLEPTMVNLNNPNPGVSGTSIGGGGLGGFNGSSATLPRAESTLFRGSGGGASGGQLQHQQSIPLNSNPNVWMNTLSKKSTVGSSAWSATQQNSASRYNLAAASAAATASGQVDSNFQLQQQLQQLQIRFFKGISLVF